MSDSGGLVMDDRKWERWGGLGGVLFVVLVVASVLIPGSPPKTSDSAAKIAKFVGDNGDALRWASFLGAIGTIGLFWFLASMWRVLRRAEGGNPRLAVMAVLGATFAAVMGAIGAIMLAGVAIVGVGGVGGQTGIRFFYILSTNLGVGTVVGIAVFLAACSAVIVRTGVFPKWLGWLGALLAIVAALASASTASTRDEYVALGFVAFAGFTLWLLVVSIMIVAGRGAEPAASGS
jgi:hypothetical protein